MKAKTLVKKKKKKKKEKKLFLIKLILHLQTENLKDSGVSKINNSFFIFEKTLTVK